MIADKIIPSFYIIEITGDAVKSVIPQDYGIQKISIGSFDFQSDMHASEKIDKAVNHILQGIAKKEKVETLIEVNPEFLPSAKQLPMNEEAQEIAEEMSSTLIHENKVAIPITRSFDVLGDFVVARKQLSADNFKIEARIVANIDEYVRLKSLDQFQKFSSPTSHGLKEENKIQIH